MIAVIVNFWRILTFMTRTRTKGPKTRTSKLVLEDP